MHLSCLEGYKQITKMALQTAQYEADQQASRTREMTQFHDKFKSSLALHDEMPDLLSWAPLALNLLGQCRLLAFSENVGSIEISPPTGKWQHLR